MFTHPIKTKHIPGTMNKTEKAYADYLESLIKSDTIVRYAFEKVKLKLADKTFYTPDFFVTYNDHIEFHEVKGFWQDDARVKIKVAAEEYPEFKFIAVKKKKNGWDVEEF